ncbi:MAG: hypothetical protein K6E50_01705 [Lachnospiraceae bacterium]|nr:hypothetical protein [Lachnospiraceae bacterium]
MPSFKDTIAKNANDNGTKGGSLKAAAVAAAHNNSAPERKSNEEIAKEVIRGNWGVGQDRINKLTAAGYDASAVQKLVNEMMKK